MNKQTRSSLEGAYFSRDALTSLASCCLSSPTSSSIPPILPQVAGLLYLSPGRLCYTISLDQICSSIYTSKHFYHLLYLSHVTHVQGQLKCLLFPKPPLIAPPELPAPPSALPQHWRSYPTFARLPSCPAFWLFACLFSPMDCNHQLSAGVH